jgi:hypothetical protein
MGATTYYQISAGETASTAFRSAVEDAQYQSGHGGYTGTIAEKSTFTMATADALSRDEAFALANSLIDSKYSDKWGPSGCICLTSTARPNNYVSSEPTSYVPEFLFFGWASE